MDTVCYAGLAKLIPRAMKADTFRARALSFPSRNNILRQKHMKSEFLEAQSGIRDNFAEVECRSFFHTTSSLGLERKKGNLSRKRRMSIISLIAVYGMSYSLRFSRAKGNSRPIGGGKYFAPGRG